MTIKDLRARLEREKGKQDQVAKTLLALKTSLEEAEQSLVKHEKAREIIREVGLKTQQQLQYHISEITSMALEAVFDNPYELKVNFVERRNKTECDLTFIRNGMEVDPLEASGVGAVDVAAFALRIAIWSMGSPRTRNTIILDEPFKHLKGYEENKRVLNMVNELSRKLNLQIIMVSDERIPREDIIESADKVFEVKMVNGISEVK